MKRTYVPKEKELFPEKEELSPMRAIKIALIVYFIKLNKFYIKKNYEQYKTSFIRGSERNHSAGEECRVFSSALNFK